LPRLSPGVVAPGTDGPLESDERGASGGLMGDVSVAAAAGTTTTVGGGAGAVPDVGAGAVCAGPEGGTFDGVAPDCADATRAERAVATAMSRTTDERRTGGERQ